MKLSMVPHLLPARSIQSICLNFSKFLRGKDENQPKPKPNAGRYYSFWPVTYHRQLHGFNMCLLRRGFHTFIRGASFPSPIDVGSHNPHPLGAQRPRLHTDRCLALIPFCNSPSPSPPLVDIVLFGLLRIAVNFTILICVWERFPHPYKECFVPLSN